MLAGVFATEDDKGVPRAGDPVGVAQAVPNSVTVRGGEGRSGRQIYVGTISVVDRAAG